jgi:paraquat-inducible protein B
MSKPANKALIGAFVVGAVALVVAGILVFGSGRFLQETFKFVMYFDGSVKGLNVGSSVVFRGVKIGTVTDILLRYNPADMSVKIPVIVEIDPDRVEVVGVLATEPDPEAAIGQLIERGLRARLQMQSLVTGQLMVELDFHPDKEVKLVGGDTGYPEIPTIPSTIEELSKRIEEVPIEEIFKKLLAAVEGIEGIVNSPEVKDIMSSLNLAAEDISKLVRGGHQQAGAQYRRQDRTAGLQHRGGGSQYRAHPERYAGARAEHQCADQAAGIEHQGNRGGLWKACPERGWPGHNAGPRH